MIATVCRFDSSSLDVTSHIVDHLEWRINFPLYDYDHRFPRDSDRRRRVPSECQAEYKFGIRTFGEAAEAIIIIYDCTRSAVADLLMWYQAAGIKTAARVAEMDSER